MVSSGLSRRSVLQLAGAAALPLSTSMLGGPAQAEQIRPRAVRPRQVAQLLQTQRHAVVTGDARQRRKLTKHLYHIFLHFRLTAG